MEKPNNIQTDFNLLITLAVFFLSAGGFVYILIAAMQVIADYAQGSPSPDSFSSFFP